MAAILSDDDVTTALQALRNAPPPPDPITDPTTGFTYTPSAPDPDLQRAQQMQQDVLEARRALMLQGADTTSGAPIPVRTAVSSADDPASRLKTLQAYYPDAAALPGTDNFVYTDPASGARRTYMPMGWHVPTAGDVVSLGPTAAELGGGLLGGAGGLYVGGPWGAAAGAGVGAAAASAGYRVAVHSLLDTSDVRTPAEIARDTAVTVGVNAAAPLLGDYMVAPLIKGVINSTRYGASPALTSARALDAEGTTSGLADGLQAGVASGSKPVQSIEGTVAQMPLGGPIIARDAATRSAIGDGVSTLADNAANSASGGIRPNPETFSTNVNDIAHDIAGDWDTTREGLDNQVTNLVGANRQVSVARLQQLRDRMAAARDQAPLTLGPRYDTAIARLDGMLADAGDSGTLPFEALRNARTDIGKEINWAPRGTMAPTGQPQLQDVYDALRDTLGDAAADADRDTLSTRLTNLVAGRPGWTGPMPSDALAAHDAAVTAWNAAGGGAETAKALASPTLSSDTLLNLAKSTAPRSQAQFASLLANADPAQQATLRSGIIGRLGLDSSDNFSAAKFIKDWGDMTDVAKGQIFTGANAPLQDSLNNLATVSRGVTDAAGAKNFPQTARALQVLQTIGTAATALFTGHPGAAAGAVGLGVGAPWAVGRLLESRPFVNWLSGAMSDPSAQAWGRAVSQLGAVGEADPRLQGFVADLQKRLGSEPPAQ